MYMTIVVSCTSLQNKEHISCLSCDYLRVSILSSRRRRVSLVLRENGGKHPAHVREQDGRHVHMKRERG